MTSQTQEDAATTALEAPEGPLLDIARDPIPSFAALQQERARVFGRRHSFERFRKNVEELAATGEEGRRKGLGLWMLGDFDQAVTILAAYPDDVVAAFTHAQALMSAGRPAEAQPVFAALAKKYPDEPRPRGGSLDAQLEARLAAGREDEAARALEEALASAPATFAESAEGHYLAGRLRELDHRLEEALEEYLAARELDPTHRSNLFRLAYLAERAGLDDLALESYQALAALLPIDRSVLMNLGILYEDLGRDQDAAACYDTIVKAQPADRRARLYLEDAKAGMEMFYDEDMEKKEDRLNQILRIPITDFELSVRARNCLNKMGINALGDLVEKTENELLTYKNFGETSLAEIKEILTAKGLRLGMAREEAVASIARAAGRGPAPPANHDEASGKPISALQLSIRARRAVENLGCLTLADITQHSEQELLGMPNFGVTSMLELKSKLAEHGLKLKGEG